MLALLLAFATTAAAQTTFQASNSARVEYYEVGGDPAGSPYAATGTHSYDELDLRFGNRFSPYNTLRGQARLLANDSAYRESKQGVSLERFNLSWENGEMRLPFRLEVGDQYGFFSPGTLQRTLKGLSLDLQPRFNKLVVQRLGDFDGPARFRLVVIGPSDVANYTVRWTLAGGASETGKPARDVDDQTSTTEKAYAGFEKVELIAPTGRVAGMYVGSRDGTPLSPPSIRVQTLDERLLVPGATVQLTAQSSGVREAEAADFQCHWEVNPAIGRVEPTATALRVALVWGNCDTTLKLADNPELAGRPFPVKVKLVRQTGVLQ